MKRFTSTFVAMALLVALGQAASPESKNVPVAKAAKHPAPTSPTLPSGHGDGAAEQKIRDVLNSPTQIEFVETPLTCVIDYLKDLHHIEIQLDTPALKEAGVDESKAVTRNVKGVSLRSALRLMLDELQLKYVIRNEVLLITSSAKAESEEYMETGVYAVGDLVATARDEAGTASACFGPLKAILTNTVATKTWADNGGAGTISEIVVGNRPLLVISQTQEVHERIEDTLQMLRKVGGVKTVE